MIENVLLDELDTGLDKCSGEKGLPECRNDILTRCLIDAQNVMIDARHKYVRRADLHGVQLVDLVLDVKDGFIDGYSEVIPRLQQQ